MEYTIEQTYNDNYAPSNYLKAETTVYKNITFDPTYRWRIKSTYQVDVWLSTCVSKYVYSAAFDYIFPNETRQIQVIIESHGDWPLLNKHPSFYSGINPDNEEYFLLDEMMLLRGGNGMVEGIFDKIETGNITIDATTYDTDIFELNTTFSIYYES